ncbi:MAG: hypothetical protein AAF594_04215 [Bacteroidota bacterium]
MPTDDRKDTYDLGADLVEATEELIAIERGEKTPARQKIFDGPILVEVREDGETVWSLASASVPLDGDPEAAAVRAGLRQSQEGMAHLLGVPLNTVRNWDQGRRSPRGPALQLLRVAASHPAALLDLATTDA